MPYIDNVLILWLQIIHKGIETFEKRPFSPNFGVRLKI